MKQLVYKLKNGKMNVVELPMPSLGDGMILIKNLYSLISPGTEGGTVKAAKKGYIGKAKERPQQAKQVFETLRMQGPVQTYRAVMKRLEAYSPGGYSCVGEVIDVSDNVNGFRVGDIVACGGLTAAHAEVVTVPSNLSVKVPYDIDVKQAAYNTLGAIALQGVRQADLHLGETCAVIGLGLLGQLTAQILKASGIRIVGIDVEAGKVERAHENGVDLALKRSNSGIKNKIMDFTGQLGCDAVIITASSQSLDPINFGGAISRHKGTIVIVGDVPTGFEREPHFYKKELQVRMSCSYGPGRYDPIYEEKGIDYPAGYVRWTERRNMEAFQELIYSKKIDVRKLTTHIFNLKNAPAAYDMILTKSEPYLGILIEYDHNNEFDDKKLIIKPHTSNAQPSSVSIGFIGAGSYAQSHLLPNIPKGKNLTLNGVMTTTGTSSRSVAERFGFEFCTTNENDIIKNDGIDTVFIATRPDSHAHYILEAMKAGKNVFTEKPLCLTSVQLEEIKKCYDLFAEDSRLLMVGYNRRFSPFIRKAKSELGKGPMAINYRINAGEIPADSWAQDPEIGGGRILGEVCHFVDTMIYLTESLPRAIYANSMDDRQNLNNTFNISLAFKDSSVGNISYFSNGDKSLPKERIEIFAHGVSAIIDDFKQFTLYSKGKRKKTKLFSQDKGQKNEVQLFLDAILQGNSTPISFEELYSTSIITFKIIESLTSGQSIRL